ncbi:O-antigen ligase family protein [Elstera cyanobacteriorum]|uniref:O-antigen ligase family protein n=1 Tax=Elstera cyanobacteriorum TaxID=2022747 RepID=UPI00235363B0|nr:O-antigen ligase family protein [Elstera cyanobacteriorum]MCK6442435.1 O-antigen ligase family protein [Elstera cyanobacteriorum]
MIHALAWFLIGYSDGLVYWLINLTEITGYMVYITPVIIIYIIYLFMFCKISLSTSLARRQIFFISFAIALFFFQIFSVGEIYTVGYIQVIVMIGVSFLITDLFKENEIILQPHFANGIIKIHYIICFYAIFSWIILRVVGEDISLYIVDFDTLSGFAANRTSGLHREPSWAGYALASSYLGVLITRPNRLWLPQIAYLLAIGVTGAGAGLIMACVFIAQQVLINRRGNLVLRLGVLAVLGLLVLVVFSGRISEVLNQNDPSSQMRLESTTVAAEVIAETFPIGTGFGNYQDHAIFDPTIWGGFLDISEATYYKSDVLALNFIAELGFFGIVLTILFIMNFSSRSNFLVFVAVMIMVLTSGTVIQPAYLVLAAIIGLERGRAAREAAGRDGTV